MLQHSVKVLLAVVTTLGLPDLQNCEQKKRIVYVTRSRVFCYSSRKWTKTSMLLLPPSFSEATALRLSKVKPPPTTIVFLLPQLFSPGQ